MRTQVKTFRKPQAQATQSIQSLRRWTALASIPFLIGFAMSATLNSGEAPLQVNPSSASHTFTLTLPTQHEAAETNVSEIRDGSDGSDGSAASNADDALVSTNLLPSQQIAIQSWGLSKTNSRDAWRLTRGQRDIVVAIIDTGADITHPDLAANIWTNPGETGKDEQGRDKRTNGIDDDRNGYIDDVHGWNFARDTADLKDEHGHGTHIAGIIGANGARRDKSAIGNDGESGLVGVAPNVSLMILKYYDPHAKGFNALAATVKAIRYAVRMGAHVINYSGGGIEPNAMEYEAIREASRAGILFVAAAGNERSNSDQHRYYPADYDLPNILSVTAIDTHDEVLPTSNWGERTVDLAAPGKDILSTMPGGTYGSMTGTSQATAFATGVAVLVLAHRTSIQAPEALIEHLISTGEVESRLAGKTRSRTILNSYRALAIVERGIAAFDIKADNDSEIDSSTFTLGN